MNQNIIDYFRIILLGTSCVEVNEHGKIEHGYIFEGKKYKISNTLKNMDKDELD